MDWIFMGKKMAPANSADAIIRIINTKLLHATGLNRWEKRGGSYWWINHEGHLTKRLTRDADLINGNKAAVMVLTKWGNWTVKKIIIIMEVPTRKEDFNHRK